MLLRFIVENFIIGGYRRKEKFIKKLRYTPLEMLNYRILKIQDSSKLSPYITLYCFNNLIN